MSRRANTLSHPRPVTRARRLPPTEHTTQTPALRQGRQGQSAGCPFLNCCAKSKIPVTMFSGQGRGSCRGLFTWFDNFLSIFAAP